MILVHDDDLGRITEFCDSNVSLSSSFPFTVLNHLIALVRP
jgi:hypothetical protein